MEIHLTVGRGLGVSSKASKVAHKILTKFDDELKDELSNAAFRDCPEIDSIDLYYGAKEEKQSRSPLTESRIALSFRRVAAV